MISRKRAIYFLIGWGFASVITLFCYMSLYFSNQPNPLSGAVGWGITFFILMSILAFTKPIDDEEKTP